MRRTSIMVCPIRCGAEENLRCLERGESSGVVLHSQECGGYAAVNFADFA